MTRSSESRAQRASSGSSKSDDNNNNDDEREQAARQDERGRSRHRRRKHESSAKATRAAAAAAAPVDSRAAARRSRGTGKNNARGAPEDAAANNDVLGAFYSMLQQGAPPPQQQQQQGGGGGGDGSIRIDLRKASNVLEAAAGNLALAANLYWDDYFASHQFEAAAEAAGNPQSESKSSANANAREDPIGKDRGGLDQKPAAAAAKGVARGGGGRHQDVDADVEMGGIEEAVASRRRSAGSSRSRSSLEADSKKGSSGQQQQEPPILLAADYTTTNNSSSSSKRRLRRSLDSDFQAADDDDETKKKKRVAKRARKSNEPPEAASNNGLDDKANDGEDEDDQKMPAIRRNGNDNDNGNPEDADNDNDNDGEEPPPQRRRLNRSNVIRHQDIVQSDDDADNKEDSDGSDDHEEQEDGDADGDDNKNNNERVRRRRARRQRKRAAGEQPPRRIVGVEVENTISVSDDELGRVGQQHFKNPSNSKKHPRGKSSSSSRRSRDRDSSSCKKKESPLQYSSASSKINSKNKNDVVSRSAVMKAAKAIHRKINPNTTHLSKPQTWFLSPEQRRKRRARDSDDDDDSIDSSTDDYICDEDWLGSEIFSSPMEQLWGASNTTDPQDAQQVPSLPVPIPVPEPEPAGGEDSRNNNIDNNNNEGVNGNVVAEDDAMNISGEEEDENNAPSLRSASDSAEAPSFAGIPHTWLNAGFQLSKCGSGLVVKSPIVDDIPFFAWRQEQVNDKRNAVPPPHHCKAITAITSIVTGLLYTGASIQGRQVNFTAGKPAWSSLTVDERKREFEARLTDALSSLIFVAAQAALQRKKKAYRKAIRSTHHNPSTYAAEHHNNYSELLKDAIAERKAALMAMGNENDNDETNADDDDEDDDEEDDDDSGKENDVGSSNNNNNGISGAMVAEDNMSKYAIRRLKKKKTMPTSQEKKELMRRRLDLIPTCIWEDKKMANKARAGDGPSFNSGIRVKMSWTNIRDIRLYVKSNLRAFTEKGGIALFLETLLRIHGTDVIARKLNRCAASASVATTTAATAIVPVSGSSGEAKESQKDPAIRVVSEVLNTEEIQCKTKPTPVGLFPSLIRCTCEDRQKQMHEEKALPLNVRIDPNNLLDTTPSGTECASVELVTLLLTGRISSDWKDCSSETLGIGLLTETVGDVSHGLARPKQPVWLLKGETSYSVLTVDGTWSSGGGNSGADSSSGSSSKDGGSRSSFADGSFFPGDDLKSISKVDKPGVALNLCHWNGWYGQRSKTGMRLVASRLNKQVPSKNLLTQFSEEQRHGIASYSHKKMKSSLVMRQRRYENAIDTISAEEHTSNETKEKKTPIRPLELERIKIHSVDQKLYPKNHKMWRFDLGEDDTSTNNNDSSSKVVVAPPPPPATTMDEKNHSAQNNNWVSYFQLTSRQKRMVETKLGPKINILLWTRWPEAVIDNFAPSEGGFPVV